MNVRQKARRSDALHYDYISRRDLCNMIANLESDLEDAKAENTVLRELAIAFADCRNTTCDDCIRWDYPNGGCSLDKVMRELGVEVDK